MKFTIIGAVRSKKNSRRRIYRRVKGRNRAFSVPSLAHERWANAAVAQLTQQIVKIGPIGAGWGCPMNLCALIYSDRETADLDNLLTSVADVLQAAGVIANDKLIRGYDGSRLLLDKANPRVEVTLEPMP